MRTIGFHFFEDGNGLYKSSRCSLERPLIINCAGIFSTSSQLSTRCLGRLDFYFLYVIEGTLSLLAPGGNILMKSGDFYIIPPGIPYSYEHTEKEPLNYFWVHFTGSDAENIVSRYKFKPYPEINSVPDSTDIISSMHRFTESCASEEPFKELELSILFERLLLKLARRCGGENPIPIKKSLSHINAYYYTDIKIPALARIEGLSTSRYNALFKELMGTSPCEYIIKTRLKFACELLSTTELSIKEIAVTVGYRDPHFFSRIFKEKLGLTPKEYRLGPNTSIE